MLLGYKKKVVILTSVSCLLPAIAHVMPKELGISDWMSFAGSILLLFWAWRILAQAGVGKKWRVLVLFFGPIAALMLPGELSPGVQKKV